MRSFSGWAKKPPVIPSIAGSPVGPLWCKPPAAYPCGLEESTSLPHAFLFLCPFLLPCPFQRLPVAPRNLIKPLVGIWGCRGPFSTGLAFPRVELLSAKPFRNKENTCPGGCAGQAVALTHLPRELHVAEGGARTPTCFQGAREGLMVIGPIFLQLHGPSLMGLLTFLFRDLFNARCFCFIPDPFYYAFSFYQVYKVKYCVFITYKYMNLRER